MNIGLVARSDNGGLGTLSRLFDFGLPICKRLAINRINGERGDFCREPDERTRLADGQITVADAEWLCDGTDVVLSFETWYSAIVPWTARKRGVRTALVPMYEMLPLDAPGLHETDVSIAPTELDLITARNETPGLANARHVMVPIPCDADRIPFKLRERVEAFVHRAGHQSSGRNGTIEILNAWRHVKSSARLVVYYQGALPITPPNDRRIDCVRMNFAEYWEHGFATGDVCLHPSRHDALSLPIQEALTAGMPVIAADWWPHCDDGERKGYLPPWCHANAVPVSSRVPDRICRPFTSHRVTPESIAATVDRLYHEDISEASKEARAWAESQSWKNLRAQWLEAMRG